jgi:hypothetical protein
MFEKTGLSSFTTGGGIISGSHSGHAIILTETGIIGISLWFLIWISYFSHYVKSLTSPYHDKNYPVISAIFLIASAIFAIQFFHGILYTPLIWISLAWRYSPSPIPKNEIQCLAAD